MTTVFRKTITVIAILALMEPQVSQGVSQAVSCDAAVQTYVCLPANYSSMDLPLPKEANLILIEIHISDVLVINDRDFSITYSLYFNVQWREPRLHINTGFFQDRMESPPTEETLTPVDLNLIKDLWVPNVFIYNLKTFKVIDVLSRLAGLWVSPNKDVMYSQASQITFICPMIFDYFPLDTQVCKFQVGSYSYNSEKMIFAVSQLGYAHTSRSIVLDYDIQISPLEEADKMFVGGPLGNYSLAGFEMILQRHVSHYIITYYLPSGLFVVVSWISFLVPPDVIPGRMALLVTLFLVLVNIFNNVTTNTPKAEGLTAIEAWMLACILFVFGALAEYAAVLFHKMKLVIEPPREAVYEMSTSRTSQSFNTLCVPADNPKMFKTVCSQSPQRSCGQKCTGFTELGDTVEQDMNDKCDKMTTRVIPASPGSPVAEGEMQKIRQRMYAKIDRFFLILFPMTFIGFNGVYWYTYLSAS